jgi:hypothetical protein
MPLGELQEGLHVGEGLPLTVYAFGDCIRARTLLTGT